MPGAKTDDHAAGKQCIGSHVLARISPVQLCVVIELLKAKQKMKIRDFIIKITKLEDIWG
jgi:hypothetical protein